MTCQHRSEPGLLCLLALCICWGAIKIHTVADIKLNAVIWDLVNLFFLSFYYVRRFKKLFAVTASAAITLNVLFSTPLPALIFSGLPVCVRRHAGFCVYHVSMFSVGVWHRWVSQQHCGVALLLCAAIVSKGSNLRNKSCCNMSTWVSSFK